MKAKIHTLAVMLVATILAGCSTTPTQRIKQNPELFNSIPSAEQELIKQGHIALGFTPNMVKLALGEPDAVSTRIDRTGTLQIWRYRNYDSGYYGSYGYYGGPGPYWGGGGYWGGYYGRAYSRWGHYGPYHGGWGGWGWGGWAYEPTPVATDYLRVSFREDRVVEINQLR